MDTLNRKQVCSYIEKGLDIKLGIADKMLIYNSIKDYNPTTIDDMSHLIPLILTNFYYESRVLIELYKRQNEWEKNFAKEIFERYKQQKLNL